MPTSPVVLYNVQRLLGLGGSRIARALDATTAHGWTRSAYNAKVAAIGAVLRSATGGVCPAALILIEVEDARVVAGVTAAAGWPELIPVVPADEQVDAWDVAIAYDPHVFTGGLLHAESHTFSNRFSTRDLLVADLATNTGHLVVAATHWPSRRVSGTQGERFAAAAYCDTVIERLLKYSKEDLLSAQGKPRVPARSLLQQRWNTPVLVAGDFNDEPWDPTVRSMRDSTPVTRAVTRPPRLPQGSSLRSVASYLGLRARLFNPTWGLDHDERPPGSYSFGSDWYRIDQMLVSAGLLADTEPRYVAGSLRVHSVPAVSVRGRDVKVTTPEGYPVAFDQRTATGASDHLPVVAEFAF